MLIKHLRDEENKPFATVVATGRDQIGVSVCHPKDVFVKKKGVLIAQNRAGKGKPVQVPHKYFQEIYEAVIDMGIRASKYYKNV